MILLIWRKWRNKSSFVILVEMINILKGLSSLLSTFWTKCRWWYDVLFASIYRAYLLIKFDIFVSDRKNTATLFAVPIFDKMLMRSERIHKIPLIMRDFIVFTSEFRGLVHRIPQAWKVSLSSPPQLVALPQVNEHTSFERLSKARWDSSHQSSHLPQIVYG